MTTKSTPSPGDTGTDSQGAPGDTGANTKGEPSKGTPSDPPSGDTDDIAALRSQVESLTAERDALVKDRDKAARKREAHKSEFEERFASIEEELQTTRTELEAEKAEKAENARLIRRRDTIDEVLELVHADHRSDKKTRRLLTALEAEGTDYAAEDRPATVKAVEEILRKDHPELFEAKRRAPVLPSVGGGRNGRGGAQGGGSERLL